MNKYIESIQAEDEYFDAKKGKLVKKISIQFKNYTRIVDIKLINIEIDIKLADAFNADGSLDRIDYYIPVNLNKYEDIPNAKISKIDISFEFGETLFNDGAGLIITAVNPVTKKPERNIYTLNNDNWEYNEGKTTINTEIRYKCYKLENAEWKEE